MQCINTVNLASARAHVFQPNSIFLSYTMYIVISLSFCFRLPEVLRIFDYQSDELMSNLLTELERVKQEGENYWISKVQN